MKNKIIRRLSFILVMVMIVSSVDIPAGAEPVTENIEEDNADTLGSYEDSLTYQDGKFFFNRKGDEATITGYRDIEGGSLTIPASLTAKWTESGIEHSVVCSVVAIGDGAFCSYMDDPGLITGTLTIPPFIRSIGSYAFSGCTGFKGDLVVPDTVESIGEGAFSGCDGFDGTLSLPAGLTEIGDETFSFCKNLSGNLIIPDNVEKIGMCAFDGCAGLSGAITIPDKVESIGDSAFVGCKGFEGDLTIPSNVKRIGNEAFGSCSGLDGTLTIEEGVEEIGKMAFYSCKNLEGSITIPSSVKYVGKEAFWNCTGFDGTLTIKSGVAAISENAFCDCSGLSGNLIIPDSVKTIGKGAFDNCESLSGNLKLPSGLETIEDRVFLNCQRLSGNLIIPKGVRSIGDSAFYSCCGLTGDLIIPDKVTSIGKMAFMYDGFDRTLTIPKSVKQIGTRAFMYCEWIKRVENKSSVIIDLEEVSAPKSRTWRNEETGEIITSIANGVAIRDDYLIVRSRINGRGKGNYELTVLDKSGKPMPNTWVYYQFYDEKGSKAGNEIVEKTNKEGKVLIQSPTFENLNVRGTTYKRKYKAEVFSGGNKFDKLEIPFDITVKPLSFSQTWSLRDEVSLEASIGEKAGISLGPIKAEAAVAEAKADGGVGSTLSATHEYDNGKRNLELVNEYDANIGVNGSLGPTAKAEAVAGVELSAFNVNGEANIGSSVHAGKRIENYDPGNNEHLNDIGLFMLGTTATATGNEFLVMLANAMGVDIYNIYGSDATLHLNANANIINLEIKNETTDDNVASGTFGKAEYDSTYTYGVDQKAGESGLIYYMEKDSAVTGSLAEANIEAIGWSGTPSSWTSEIAQRYRLEAAGDSFLVEQQVSKEDIETTWLKGSQEIKEQYVYNGAKLGGLYSSVPEFAKFAGGKSFFILDSAFKDINDKLNHSMVEAEYARTANNKTVLSTGDLDFGAQLGVGFDIGMCLSGIVENAYEIQSGTFGRKETDDIAKTNITAINDIDDPVAQNSISIVTLIKEPLLSVAEKAKSFINTVIGEAGEAIKNKLAKAAFAAGNYVKGRFLSIAVVNDDSLISSYVLTSYGSKRLAGLSAAGDEMKGEAVSVGDPYYVFVLESDGKTVVDDFSDSPVELTLSYTDDMLSSINASAEDEKDIEMFKYSEEKCGYVSIGGEVDPDGNSVTETITKPGQYVLAINKRLSDNSVDPAKEKKFRPLDLETLAKTSTKTFTAGSDTYAVSWNSFVRFDGRKHNGAGKDAAGDLYKAKETGKKAFDIILSVTKNGELVDPKNYKIKTKNNKTATVSIDGITPIRENNKKLPSFTIKFKGKEFKEANKSAKKEKFEFGIIPAELTKDNVTFNKVKTLKDGSLQVKKATYKPEVPEGRTAPKAIKLKFSKKEKKTDYIQEPQADGSVKITGKNNYYGSVIYQK